MNHNYLEAQLAVMTRANLDALPHYAIAASHSSVKEREKEEFRTSVADEYVTQVSDLDLGRFGIRP